MPQSEFAMIVVTLLRLGLVALLVTLLWQGRSQRLDVTLEQAQTIYVANAGAYRVTMTLTPHGNDNGPVTIEIQSDGQVVGVIDSSYNYDFFANQPAGWFQQRWIDGDWRRDLLLATTDGAGYAYVSSQDGKLYWTERGD
jgi:hypothetical protein